MKLDTLKTCATFTCAAVTGVLISLAPGATHAQGAAPAAGASAAAPVAPVPEEKRVLAERIIKAQQGNELDRMSNGLAQQSVGRLVQEAGMVLERQVPKANREAAGKQLNEALDAYLKDASSTIKAKAPTTLVTALTPVYAEKFSTEELKQLAVFFESEASKKYQLATPELGQAMLKAIVKDTEGQINPKMMALAKKVEDILGKNGAKKAEGQGSNGAGNKGGAAPGSSPKNPLKPSATTPEGVPVPRPGASK